MKHQFMLAILFSAFVIHSGTAHAISFGEKCADITSCAKIVSELLDQHYVFDTDVKGKVWATPKLEITKENAELLFTNMLSMNGFSRVPVGQPNTFQIMRQRDARDQPIPTVSASQDVTPQLPNTWDLMTLKYKATNPEVVENIARTSRSFMPPNSRIIPETLSGTLLITDTALNLKKLYGIIKDLDKKPTAEMKKHWEDETKARHAEMMMQKKCEDAQPKAQQPQKTAS